MNKLIFITIPVTILLVIILMSKSNSKSNSTSNSKSNKISILNSKEGANQGACTNPGIPKCYDVHGSHKNCVGRTDSPLDHKGNNGCFCGGRGSTNSYDQNCVCTLGGGWDTSSGCTKCDYANNWEREGQITVDGVTNDTSCRPVVIAKQKWGCNMQMDSSGGTSAGVMMWNDDYSALDKLWKGPFDSEEEAKAFCKYKGCKSTGDKPEEGLPACPYGPYDLPDSEGEYAPSQIDKCCWDGFGWGQEPPFDNCSEGRLNSDRSGKSGYYTGKCYRNWLDSSICSFSPYAEQNNIGTKCS